MPAPVNLGTTLADVSGGRKVERTHIVVALRPLSCGRWTTDTFPIELIDVRAAIGVGVLVGFGASPARERS